MNGTYYAENYARFMSLELNTRVTPESHPKCKRKGRWSCNYRSKFGSEIRQGMYRGVFEKYISPKEINRRVIPCPRQEAYGDWFCETFSPRIMFTRVREGYMYEGVRERHTRQQSLWIYSFTLPFETNLRWSSARVHLAAMRAIIQKKKALKIRVTLN